MPDHPAATEAGRRRSAWQWSLVVLGWCLAGVGVWLIISAHSQRNTELGIVAGLWGALLGAYGLFGPSGRREPDDIGTVATPSRVLAAPMTVHTEALSAALAKNSELVLAADARQHQAFEQRMEGMLQLIGRRVGEELGRLHSDVAQLRTEVLENVGGQIRLERVETTRLIGSNLEALQQELRQLANSRQLVAPAGASTLTPPLPTYAPAYELGGDVPSVTTLSAPLSGPLSAPLIDERGFDRQPRPEQPPARIADATAQPWTPVNGAATGHGVTDATTHPWTPVNGEATGHGVTDATTHPWTPVNGEATGHGVTDATTRPWTPVNGHARDWTANGPDADDAPLRWTPEGQQDPLPPRPTAFEPPADLTPTATMPAVEPEVLPPADPTPLWPAAPYPATPPSPPAIDSEQADPADVFASMPRLSPFVDDQRGDRGSRADEVSEPAPDAVADGRRHRYRAEDADDVLSRLLAREQGEQDDSAR